MPTADSADTAVRTPHVGRYELDAEGSVVSFRTRHMFGLAPVHGTVAITKGVAEVVDPITESRVHVEIDATSFDTGNERRDTDVRSAKYLDTEQHPTILFASERLEHSAEATVLVGRLTVHGVTRSVRLSIQRSDVQTGPPASFTAEASVRIDRTEFGVTAGRGMTGRYLTMTLQTRWVRQERTPGE